MLFRSAWFERYVTDWTGPTGRLGRMTFRMNTPVFPGDHMVLAGTVTSTEVDAVGCGWVDLDVSLEVDGAAATTCVVRVALPIDSDDNPWRRHGDRWRP